MQCIYLAAKALKNGAFGALSLFVIKIRYKKTCHNVYQSDRIITGELTCLKTVRRLASNDQQTQQYSI